MAPAFFGRVTEEGDRGEAMGWLDDERNTVKCSLGDSGERLEVGDDAAVELVDAALELLTVSGDGSLVILAVLQLADEGAERTAATVDGGEDFRRRERRGRVR